jgi:hypothetical protein
MVDMPQTVYFLVLQWLVDVPTSHFEHIRRGQLGVEASRYLFVSAAAWSPSRAAMVRIALRLMVCDGERYIVWYERMVQRVHRQQDRALQAVRFLDPRDSPTTRVRQLARAYQVETEVTRRLLRLHPQMHEAAASIRADAERLMVEDDSSDGSED